MNYGSGFGIFSSGGSGGGVAGSGTANYLARWTDSTTLGIGVVQDDATTVGIGTSPVSGQMLTVRGTGTANTTTALLVESSAGNDRFIINDDGRMAWGIGSNASTQASFGLFAAVSNYNFGFGFYGTNTASAVVTIQMLGTTSDKGLVVATQGSKTGEVTGVESSVISTGNTTGYGVRGIARNASQIAAGIRGEFSASGSVTPSQYGAGVIGSSQGNVNTIQYGVIGSTFFNNVSLTFTQDLIGVFGEAFGTLAAQGTSSNIIGGKFQVRQSSTTSGDAIALLVPSTDNEGTIVFGADSVSANASFVEVTGDIEIIGNAVGLILEDRTTSTRYRLYIDNGILSQEAA